MIKFTLVVMLVGLGVVVAGTVYKEYLKYKLESERHFCEYLAWCSKCRNYRPLNNEDLEHWLDKKENL